MIQKLQTNRNAFLGVISGVSVFYFLYFLDAFSIQRGLSYSGHSHLFRSISFGILTFFYQFILEVWVKKRLNLSTIGKQIAWYIGLVFLGSQLTFVLFNFFWNWQELDWMGYGLIQMEYPLMMIFPLSVYLLIQRIITMKTPKVDYFTFCSDNNKDQLRMKLEDFLFAKSSENYITIYYKAKQGFREHLIRKTLKNLEIELTGFSSVKRNHRSYLVNTLNIDHVLQKKEKTFIQIESFSLPVSKKYKALFLEEPI